MASYPVGDRLTTGQKFAPAISAFPPSLAVRCRQPSLYRDVRILACRRMDSSHHDLGYAEKFQTEILQMFR